MEKVSVIGAGAWGTTLANLLAGKGYEVALWCFEKETAESINARNENKTYLKGIGLNEKVFGETDINKTVEGSEAVLIAIPTKFLRKTLESFSLKLPAKMLVLSVTKGIENGTLKMPSQIIAEVLSLPSVAVLSGPNLSREIAQGKPAATAIACKDESISKKLQEIINTTGFRVYTSTDVTGVELGGALKNVIAIAAGICDGLKLGNNAKSALMVRGIAEISRLGTACGARTETFFGLSGMGDLITTCQSDLSRNHFVGVEISKGRSIKDILSEMKAVPEGVDTAISALELSKRHGIEMPITNEVNKVLFENKDPKEAIFSLMTRKLKSELYQ